MRRHSLLQDHTPGTTPYTQALRALLPIITTGPDRDLHDLSRWETLRDRHLKLIAPHERADHALALTPRALLGGFELSAYLAGFLVMVILALCLFVFLPSLNTTLATVLSVFAGMGTVVLVNTRFDTLRVQALHRLGLQHAPDPPHLNGTHL